MPLGQSNKIEKPSPGRVVQVRNDWVGSVITGMTPARLARILTDAIGGDIYNQAIMMEEMEERDTHIFSVLQTRKLAVINRPFMVLPGDDKPESIKDADLIKMAIDNLPDFHEDLLDILDAVGKGFSILEIEWENKNNLLLPADMHWIPQHRFIPDTEDPYKEFRLLSKAEPIYGEELAPNKFITHIYRAKSGMPVRGGILRIAAWMYLFKHYSIKDWLIFMEIYGIPLRIGKYDQATSDPDIEVLKTAVRNLGTDAAAVISKSTEIEIVEALKSGGAANPHENLAKFCNFEISKAVLGQTETADSVPGRLGAANEKSEVRFDLTKADVRSLENRLKIDLIKPIINLNVGPREKYPTIKWDLEGSEDLKQASEIDATLVTKIGLPLSKKYFYEKYNRPQPEKEDELVFPIMGKFNPFVINDK